MMASETDTQIIEYDIEEIQTKKVESLQAPSKNDSDRETNVDDEDSEDEEDDDDDELTESYRPPWKKHRVEDSQNDYDFGPLTQMKPMTVEIENELKDDENSRTVIRTINGENIRFIKAHPSIIFPTRGSALSAGFDLHTPMRITLAPFERFTVNIGIEVEMPENCYGRIASRSGLASLKGIITLAGVIDRDYHGQIEIILYNTDSKNTWSLRKSSRIAQIIFERIYEEKEEEKGANEKRGRRGLGKASGLV